MASTPEWWFASTSTHALAPGSGPVSPDSVFGDRLRPRPRTHRRTRATRSREGRRPRLTVRRQALREPISSLVFPVAHSQPRPPYFGDLTHPPLRNKKLARAGPLLLLSLRRRGVRARVRMAFATSLFVLRNKVCLSCAVRQRQSLHMLAQSGPKCSSRAHEMYGIG